VDVDDRIELSLATAQDEPAIRALLAAAALPVDDVAVGAQEYVVAREGGALVGCVGLEPRGDDALLRSFAVVPARRGGGLGTRLFERVVERARERGIATAYVLTTTAERFCLAHGFERISRAEVPARIAATSQFRTLCPTTAACFRLRVR
jgi:amino-acid N-acetyltransferase